MWELLPEDANFIHVLYLIVTLLHYTKYIVGLYYFILDPNRHNERIENRIDSITN